MSATRMIARAVLRIAPRCGADWAGAMAMEVLHAEGPGARRFAAGCLVAAARMRIDAMGRDAMTNLNKLGGQPRLATMSCGTAATLLGLVYLAATGAPASLLVANAGALLLGLLAFAVAGTAIWPGAVVPACGLALLATALAGLELDGAARWVRVAGLSIQPSLVLVPAALVLHLARRSAATTAGMIASAAALALQPDRAMAGVLLLGLIAGGRRSGTAAIGAAAIGFVATLLRPDTLPAVPWVDGVLASAVRAGIVPGAAAIGGTVILLIPALIGLRGGRAETRAFGATWIAIVAAAALGNYPMPLVGFGGSAILGYFLAAGWLPRRDAPTGSGPSTAHFEHARPDTLLRIA